MAKKACVELARATYCLSKKTADFIKQQAEYHGTSEDVALENLLWSHTEKNSEIAAVLAIMNINHIIRPQTDEQQTHTMFIIAGALLKCITDTGKYNIDEAFSQTYKNFGEFRRIIDDIMKKEDEE